MCLRHKHIILSLALLFVALSPIGAQVSNSSQELPTGCSSRIVLLDTSKAGYSSVKFVIAQGDSALYHLWSANNFRLDTLGTATDTLKITVRRGDTDTVVLTSLHFADSEYSRNIVTNGDLEQGYVYFNVDHRLTYQRWPSDTALLYPGNFAVDTNPRLYRSSVYPDTLHDGNMLMVHSLPCDSNGLCVDSLFAATLYNIDTDGYYLLSFEAATLVSPITEITLGFSAGDTTYNLGLDDNFFLWRDSTWLWHAHGLDSVNINIVISNPNPTDGDTHSFAIDNIAVRQLCKARDTVRLAVLDSVMPDTTFHRNRCIDSTVVITLPLSGSKVVVGSDTSLLDSSVVLLQQTDNYGTIYSYTYLSIRVYVVFDTIFEHSDTAVVSGVLLNYRDLFREDLTFEDELFLAKHPWFVEVLDTSFVRDHFEVEGCYSGIMAANGYCDSTIHYHFRFPLNCDSNLGFPTVVTPNNDGVNDCFGIYNMIKETPDQCHCYEHSTLKIYNRWGKLVYHVKDMRLEEDFWCPGNEPEGVYFYYFTAQSYYDSSIKDKDQINRNRYMVRRQGFFHLIKE